jgi:Domain of unknown function (DUF4424)
MRNQGFPARRSPAIPSWVLVLVFLGSMLFVAAPWARGNDSEAATGVGGLTLTQSNEITMDSEELFISSTKVTVKYRFTNRSDTDVSTLIAFPLPKMPGDFGPRTTDLSAYEEIPDFNDFKFTTKVDGKAVRLGIATTVNVDGRSVESRLKELNWPLRWFEDANFIDTLKELPPESKQQFIAEGLLVKQSTGEVVPAWDLTMNFTRTQVFPAHKTVSVEHNYEPFAGGSVGGGLVRERSSYERKYCADGSFYKQFKARQSKRSNSEMYSETWVSYILTSGANWKGPIKKFRLVVDKGVATNLVSFCMTGVKKISPTQFEVRKTNFEPTQDLDILIVK